MPIMKITTNTIREVIRVLIHCDPTLRNRAYQPSRDCPDSISSWPETVDIRVSKAIQGLVRTSHGNLLRLLADFATERPLRRQSRDGRAHFDTREA